MMLQEFKDHLMGSHPAIWARRKDDSLQEFYAAAQRHRQVHLTELDEQRQEFRIMSVPLDHAHHRPHTIKVRADHRERTVREQVPGKFYAPGARDVDLWVEGS